MPCFGKSESKTTKKKLKELSKSKKLRENENIVQIYIFSNGRSAVSPKCYRFQEDKLNKWKKAIKKISKRKEILINNLVLHDLRGKPIIKPNEIKDFGGYVAVGVQNKFIPGNYFQTYEKFVMTPFLSTGSILSKSALTIRVPKDKFGALNGSSPTINQDDCP